MKQPEIIKETTIVVQTATVDTQYGKLKVIDTQGKSYTVSDKRKALFAMFQPGATIKLRWGNYQNKDYIADAVQTAPPTTLPPAPGGQGKASDPPRVEVSEPNLRNRSFALSYAKDLAVSGKIDISQVLPMAATFDLWLQGK